MLQKVITRTRIHVSFRVHRYGFRIRAHAAWTRIHRRARRHAHAVDRNRQYVTLLVRKRQQSRGREILRLNCIIGERECAGRARVW